MKGAGDRQHSIAKIASLPAALAEAVAGLTDAQLDTPYGEGKWTIRQVVNHVSDSHMNGFCRMKLVLTESHPTLKPYDQNAWAVLADTAGYPVSAALQILSGLHERWVVLLKSVRESDWQRTGFHPESGELTLDDLLVDYAEHGEKHIGHIMGLRRAREW